MTSSTLYDWNAYREDFEKAARNAKYDEAYIEACLEYAQPLAASNLPIIYDGVHFSLLVGYEPSYVYGAANSQKGHYRSFSITKKNGGLRSIAEPLPSLKEIQRWILDNILSKIKVNAAAKAYIIGKSTKDNARFHRKQPIVIRIDIKDFFPSIGVGAIYSIFSKIGYSQTVSQLLTKLCTLRGSIPQGAPTSAALSNLVFRPLDARLFGYARSKGLRYTRYADDLTFSGEVNIGETVDFVREILFSHKFLINNQKTLIMRKGSRQVVTGIVVNEYMKAPREFRRDFRKTLHFIEKYGIESHASRLNITRANYIDHLIGQASHILSIDKNDKVANYALPFLYKIKKDISDV